MSRTALNIAFVTSRADVMGGASTHLLDLAKGAKDAGHQVTVFAGGKGVLMDYLQMLAIDRVSLKHMQGQGNPFSDVASVLELRRRLSLLKPDVVHCHTFKAGVVGRLAAKSLSIPVVYTVHGWAFNQDVSPRRQHLYRMAERAMASLSDRIITGSDFERHLALQNGVGRADRITTVHPGLHDVQQQRPATVAHTPLRLIMVGRFDEPKDRLRVLRDFAKLAPASATLKFIGEGAQRDPVTQAAAALGVSDRVTFKGWPCDIAQQLADSDVFVLASKREGLPLNVLEAMRAGLPVIASDVGGVREAVEDGGTGILVHCNDSDGFRRAMQSFVDNPTLVPQMGHKARQKYEKEFTFPAMLEATLGLYRNLTPDANAHHNLKAYF